MNCLRCGTEIGSNIGYCEACKSAREGRGLEQFLEEEPAADDRIFGINLSIFSSMTAKLLGAVIIVVLNQVLLQASVKV